MDSQQLGWGIVGPVRIAATQIAPAIAAAPNSTLISVVSGDLGRATEFAKAHGAAQALDSYPAMLADPAVQAVYIATPNALHAGQVIAAADAGKRVLCDKPLAVTVQSRAAMARPRTSNIRDVPAPSPIQGPPSAAFADEPVVPVEPARASLAWHGSACSLRRAGRTRTRGPLAHSGRRPRTSRPTPGLLPVRARR